MVFSIKTSRNAHIALSAIPDVTGTQTYEIGIMAEGGKSTYIRDEVKGSNFLIKKTTTDLLNKTEFRTFWLSWSKQVVCLYAFITRPLKARWG